MDIASGAENWTARYPHILFEIALCGRFTFVGSRGRVVAFDMADGSPVAEWTTGNGGDFRGNIVSRGDTVFAASEEGEIAALRVEQSRSLFGRRRHTLSPAWRTELDSPVQYFAFDDDRLMAVTGSCRLHHIDPADETITERMRMPKFTRTRGVIRIEGRDYILAADRTCARVAL